MALMHSAALVGYLRDVESQNQGKNWAQIVSKLHQHFYSHDTHVVIAGISLFVDGPENKGWQDVKLPIEPARTILHKGAKVNIAHSYAGIRAMLNRSGPSAFVMKHVNTGLGDSVQVWADWIEGSKQNVAGCLQWWVSPSTGGRKVDAGWLKVANAKHWKPEAQVRGNYLGLVAAKSLRTGRAMVLSKAFEWAFADSPGARGLVEAFDVGGA